jgi:hypothetical protein
MEIPSVRKPFMILAVVVCAASFVMPRPERTHFNPPSPAEAEPHRPIVLVRVDGELATLRAAVIAYWIRKGKKYPADIHSALVEGVSEIIPKPLKDPFDSDPEHHTYGYVVGKDTAFGDYFAIYTRGPRGDSVPKWDKKERHFVFSGSGQIVSNAPIARH